MAKRSSYGAKTLPGEYFQSSEIFELEKERIFARNWQCLGRASRLKHPGSFFLNQIGKENLIIVRNHNNEIRAFHNVCRHRGTQLCTEKEGEFSGSIQCPYHAWSYNLNGALVGAPNMKDAQNFSMKDYPLHSIPVAEWEGFIFLNLSENPVPFEEAFASVLNDFQDWRISELEVAHRMDYDVAANWKLIFQNYSECYHCPKVHPTLNRLTPYRNSSICVEEGPILGGPMQLAEEVRSMTVDGRTCAAPLGDVSGEDLKHVYYYTIFPTMFLSLHPDYVLVHRLEPVRPDQTKVICEWLFHPSAIQDPAFDCKRAVDFWDETNRQDWHVCELSQRGTSSRAYTPGPYADLESLLAAFDRHYLRVLNQESEFLAEVI